MWVPSLTVEMVGGGVCVAILPPGTKMIEVKVPSWRGLAPVVERSALLRESRPNQLAR